MRRSWLAIGSIAVLLAVGLAIACSGGTETPPPSTEAPPPSSAAPAEARAVWDEPSFELRGDAPGPYTAGTEGHFTIRLTPRGNYHVNQDYPLSITLTGPAGVTFPHATVTAEQAETMTEPLAAFSIPFTASSAGAQHVTALVDFAVCTPEACMPDTRTVAVDLSVN
jgi:hypothetical protein